MFKRYIRAAAALNDVFDDKKLSERVGRKRAAIGNWWKGSRPDPDLVPRLAEVTGFDGDELWRFVFLDGPPPTFPDPGSPVESSVAEGLRLDRERPLPEDPGKPGTSPRRRPRGSGAGRGGRGGR